MLKSILIKGKISNDPYLIASSLILLLLLNLNRFGMLDIISIYIYNILYNTINTNNTTIYARIS
jgi:hypothetical protein